MPPRRQRASRPSAPAPASARQRRAPTSSAAEAASASASASATTGRFTQAFVKTLPAGWQTIVADNWEQIQLDRTTLHLRPEDDFLEEQKQQCVISTLLNNANAMENYLSRSGKANSLMERYFALYPPAQIEKMVEFASQQSSFVC